MKELFDPIEEMESLRENQLFTTRNFMVAIYSEDGMEILFRPSVISNFSTDRKKIFITLYDMVTRVPIEEILDDLSKGFWWFKKKVKIVLFRLDNTNSEIYRVEYNKCKLKNYHGKNFSYNSDGNHLWYLEFDFCEKEIIVDAKNKVKANEDRVKKEISIIRNSNKMLDDAIERVKGNKKTNRNEKAKLIQMINKAKNENVITEHFLGSKIDMPKLDGVDFSKIEKDIVKKISELEDNKD